MSSDETLRNVKPKSITLRELWHSPDFQQGLLDFVLKADWPKFQNGYRYEYGRTLMLYAKSIGFNLKQVRAMSEAEFAGLYQAAHFEGYLFKK